MSAQPAGAPRAAPPLPPIEVARSDRRLPRRSRCSGTSTSSCPTASWSAIVGPNGAGKIDAASRRSSAWCRRLPGRCGSSASRTRAAPPASATCRSARASTGTFPTDVLDVVLMGTLRPARLVSPRRGEHDRATAARLPRSRSACARFARRQISQLSGGQQQRVFLARALAQEARRLFHGRAVRRRRRGDRARDRRRCCSELRAARQDGASSCTTICRPCAEYFDWVMLLNMRLRRRRAGRRRSSPTENLAADLRRPADAPSTRPPTADLERARAPRRGAVDARPRTLSGTNVALVLRANVVAGSSCWGDRRRARLLRRSCAGRACSATRLATRRSPASCSPSCSRGSKRPLVLLVGALVAGIAGRRCGARDRALPAHQGGRRARHRALGLLRPRHRAAHPHPEAPGRQPERARQVPVRAGRRAHAQATSSCMAIVGHRGARRHRPVLEGAQAGDVRPRLRRLASACRSGPLEIVLTAAHGR